MKKRILRNWGLKLISVLLALVIWFVVVMSQDPKDTVTFPNIPVDLINTELFERENKVFEVLDNTDTVRVTVEAPRSVITQLRATDIVAEADVGKLTDINTIAITYGIQNVDVEVNRITGNHDVVRLSVEDRSTKWVRIDYDTVGEVAEGYIVSSVSPGLTMIQVTGPESAVDRISYAGVEVNVSGASRDVSANVEARLYDAEGNLLDLPNVVMDADNVHMDVEILATKEVPVEVIATGNPAEGYLATGVVESDVATVMIAGRVSTLSNVSKISIPEEILDITGLTENLERTVNLRDYLPDNTRLADTSFNGRVNVTVYVEPVVERELVISESNVSVQNLPEGLMYELAETEEPYSLTISGLNAAVSAVQESAVTGTVDILEWMNEQEMEELRPGSYELPLSFEFPEDVNIENEVIITINIDLYEEETE